MRLRVDARVHHHDLDAGLGGGVGGGDEALGVTRIEDEQVDALRHHVLDVGNLLAHVVLAVGLRHIASGLFRFVHGGGDLGGEIGGAQRVHGDADLAGGGLSGAVRPGRKRCGEGESRKG